MTDKEKNGAFKECLERISEKFGRVKFRERLMLRIAFDFGADLAEPERCSYKYSVLDDTGAAVSGGHLLPQVQLRELRIQKEIEK